MNSEPKISPMNRESEPPVPVILFLIFGALFFAGELYLDKFGGGFNAKVYQPYDSWKMVEDLQPKGAGDIMFAKGKKVFETAGCVACHQATGLGAAGIAPPLAGSEWVLTPSPNRIIRVAQDGLAGPLAVKGAQFNLVMPAMGQQLGLSDEDMAAVLTFIRGNKEWGNNASPVTPEQVKAVRNQIKGRATPWTAEELLAIPEK
jgi:mono/diheme cytochrome c family protein